MTYVIKQLTSRGAWITGPVRYADEASAWRDVIRLGRQQPGTAWRVAEVRRG